MHQHPTFQSFYNGGFHNFWLKLDLKHNLIDEGGGFVKEDLGKDQD